MDFKRLLASAPRKRDVGPERPLLTPWGEVLKESEALGAASVRGEHPHPQFARERFTMLNGWWDYAIVANDGSAEDAHRGKSARAVGGAPAPDAAASSACRPPAHYDGRILVPFSPEALLSGVGRQLQPSEALWYRTRTDAPRLSAGGRCLLHFEAVDYACTCWVNGRKVASHEGGYDPFAFDITEALDQGGSDAEAMEIVLRVTDPSDRGPQPRGKQKLERGGIWYTAQSGIWQPVWLEVVPEHHVRTLALHPDADGARLIADVEVVGDEGVVRLALIDPDGCPVGEAEAAVEAGLAHLSMPLENLRRWSPDDPALYPLTVTYGDDVVSSYTAFRTVEVRRADDGRFRFFLNGEPLLVRGVLDQGYWSDGLMTAPSDEALVYDIQAMQDAGFNMLRKHLKVEADRWYYHCDRLGMLVWQDMVSGGGPYDSWQTSFRPSLWRGSWDNYDDRIEAHQRKLGAGDPSCREAWLLACRRTVEGLRNHPSVVSWCLFNEAWGQFDAIQVAGAVHEMDPTRPIDATSGWYDQYAGDFLSVHNYFRKLKVYPDHPARLVGSAAKRGGRAFAISEFGGAVHAVAGHSAFAESYGYGTIADAAAWRAEVRRQLNEVEALEADGLSLYVYTQLSDVEEETNGILTYDRRVNKFEPNGGEETGDAV